VYQACDGQRLATLQIEEEKLMLMFCACRGRPKGGGLQWSACVIHSTEQPIKEDAKEVFTNYFTTPANPGYRFLVYGFV